MDKQSIINLAIQLLKEGKTTELVANGISMFPMLHPGDTLIIQPRQNIKLGDVIVFKGSDILVAHRIVRIENDQVYCKGDSLFSMDPPIFIEDILGKVVERRRQNKVKSLDTGIRKLFAKQMPKTRKYPSLLFRWWALIWLKVHK